LKVTIEILCLCWALAASAAFDSAEWLSQREMFAREAERLQNAYSNLVMKVENPADDIKIPLEVFPDGRVESYIHAQKAVFFQDRNMVWAEGVLVRKLDESGNVVSQIDARNCLFDRETKSGWVEGRARIRHGKAVFHGRGIYFSSPDAYVMVSDESSVESKDLSFGGLK